MAGLRQNRPCYWHNLYLTTNYSFYVVNSDLYCSLATPLVATPMWPVFQRHFYCLIFVNHTNYVSGHLRSNLIGKTIYTNKRECLFVDLYIFKINDNPYLRLSNMLILCLVKWNVYELQKYDSYSYHYDLAPLVLIIRHFVMKCQWRSMCYEISMKINVF